MLTASFRVRSIDTGEILNSNDCFSEYDFFIDSNGVLYRVFYRDGVSEATDCKYELWTGLTDHQGVKIFEGDRVRAWNKRSPFTHTGEIVEGVVVRYCNHFALLSDENVYNCHWDNAELYEVIL